MTVAELINELSQHDPNLNVMSLYDFAFVPVSGVSPASGSNYVILRMKIKQDPKAQFGMLAEGLVHHLAEIGMSHEHIAEVMGRSVQNVERKLKAPRKH